MFNLALYGVFSRLQSIIYKTIYKDINNDKETEIMKGLEKWRRERGLDDNGQLEGIGKNITSELEEYEEAVKNNDVEGMIDALCDITVFLINGGSTYQIAKMVPSIKAFELGYDFDLCMLETIKEISSRTGHWSEEDKKWIKDTSPEAQAKWYKADYSKCKLQ